MDELKLLAGFTSYFSIFTGINLAGAGSNKFRKALLDQIFLEEPKQLQAELLTVHNAIEKGKIIILDDGSVDKASGDYIAAHKDFNTEMQSIDAKYQNPAYDKLFRSAFLNTAFFCIFYIILSGCEPIMKDARVRNGLFVLNCSIIYTAIIFFVSLYYTKKNIELRKDARFYLYLPAILFLIVIFIICGGCFFFPNPQFRVLGGLGEHHIVFFSLFVAATTYVCYFICAYKAESKYSKELLASISKNSKTLDKAKIRYEYALEQRLNNILK